MCPPGKGWAVRETLGELWGGWAHGSGRVFLGLAFIALVAVWVAAVTLTFREARRTWRSPAATTPWVVAVPVLVAAIGVAQPGSFHLRALLGLSLAPVLALLVGVAVRRSTVKCPRGHTTMPSRALCPWGPRPPLGLNVGPAAVSANFVGRSIGTLLRPAAEAAPPPPPPPAPSPAVSHGPVLLWLVPEV